MLFLSLAALLAPSAAGAAPVDTPDNNFPQTNGRVSAILRVNGTIYLGGTFTSVGGFPRNRLAAIDANTGAVTPWNPNANNWVMALAASPDGSRIYAGGTFGAVGGTGRNRIAAVSAATGRVDTSWNAGANGEVRTISASGGRVYLGGEFSSVNGSARTRLAAVAAANGAVDPAWRPAANGLVRKLAVSPNGDGVYVAGAFTNVSGLSRPHIARLDATTGAPASWRPSPGRPVLDLVVSGGRVYTAENGTGGAASAYDAQTGATAWRLLGDGDAQAVTVHEGLVYVGGHFDTLGGQTRRMFAAISPATGALDPRWNPSADRGIWALTPDPARGRLYAGGSFTRINGQPRQGLARFSE